MAQFLSKEVSFQNLERELNHIFALKPNDLKFGWLTAIYKWLTHPLKRMPFLYFIPAALTLALLLYLFFGQLVIRLVSILQYGF